MTPVWWGLWMRPMLGENRYLLYGFLVSLVTHLLVVVFVPGQSVEVSPSMEPELIEVELLPLEFGSLGSREGAVGLSRQEAEALSQLDRQTLALARRLPLGIFLQRPGASSEGEFELEADQVPDRRLPRLVERVLQRLARSGQETGASGRNLIAQFSFPPASPKEEVRLPKPIQAQPGPEKARRSGLKFELAGPVSTRRIVYRPPLEKVTITRPGSVRIKFWVEPDGTVSRIIFEQKVEANLDDFSARYVRGLRFEALPEGKRFVQWGTITITFRVG